MKLRANHSDNTRAHVCTHMCVHMWCTHAIVHVHAHTHTHTHTGSCPCFSQMCMHMHACVHAHTCTRTHTHTRTYMQICTCMHAHTHTYTHLLTHSLTHTCIHMYICSLTHMHHTHTPTYMCMGVFCVVGFIKFWMYGEAKCSSLLKLLLLFSLLFFFFLVELPNPWKKMCAEWSSFDICTYMYIFWHVFFYDWYQTVICICNNLYQSSQPASHFWQHAAINLNFRGCCDSNMF